MELGRNGTGRWHVACVIRGGVDGIKFENQRVSAAGFFVGSSLSARITHAACYTPDSPELTQTRVSSIRGLFSRDDHTRRI